ncbi:M15 family metallopeptidase [Phaeocystidibacter luteus]|uniref:M15 family metallopeptidase n=1 Tax=Phaeocystidibacter luteus TaxID=911197 RepID=A0A6N6RJS2_9FLAO|nr:M15 family metallopeptidase [Phaeocystidibacter luteus]KAB2807752.1 M15 family metallopeptidase [Phaeocystidibacter luteus]
MIRNLTLTIILAFITVAAVYDAPEYDVPELTGQFEPEEHDDFVRLKSKYTNREAAWLRKDAAAAFEEMADSAALDGIRIYVVSATRNHEYQTDIWTRKWESRGGESVEKALSILEYSSMPGTSRHHWGTDLDINSVEPSYFESGQGTRIYEWMSENAHKFGFFQPYTAQTKGRTGYNEEKWHWSYQPIARKLLKAYNHLVTPDHINGFPGSETNGEIDVIGKYVNGIAEFPGNPFIQP